MNREQWKDLTVSSYAYQKLYLAVICLVSPANIERLRDAFQHLVFLREDQMPANLWSELRAFSEQPHSTDEQRTIVAERIVNLFDKVARLDTLERE